MKKLIIASVMVLASLSLTSAPALRAQDSSDKITIKDQAEFNAYQNAEAIADAKAKAAALESFLTTYPQTVVKASVLEDLIRAYQQSGDMTKTLDAAGRLLQVDPANYKAILLSAYINKTLCMKALQTNATDLSSCDAAAAMATKGLAVAKPKDVSDDDWKKATAQAYPIYHSSIALDDLSSKKDYKGAVDEYTQELRLMSGDAAKSTLGVYETAQLATAYTKLSPPDMPNAIWFYAHAYSVATDANTKTQLEKQLNYWYKKYHGNAEGLDDFKAKAAASLFPQGDTGLKAAATPPELAHQAIASTGDLSSMALGDKEYVLANGTLAAASDPAKKDADVMWAILKDQVTPVPGVVIESSATTIKVAVTEDAKNAKTADFIVNLKTPLADKDIPAVGSELKTAPDAQLVGTYDSFTQIPNADATQASSAQIVLRDGEIQPEEKKAPAKKPAAGKTAGKTTGATTTKKPATKK